MQVRTIQPYEIICKVVDKLVKNCYHKIMSKAERIEELQEILREDNTNLPARRELAVLLLDTGYPKEALAHFIYLSKIITDDSGIFYNLGIACEKLKLYKEAKEAYLKAIELSPAELDATYNLGLVLTELREYDRAIECFENSSLH